MKKKMIFIAALVLLTCAVAWNFLARKDEATKIQEFDAFLTAYQQLNKFNGTVLVAQNGKILFQKGYGLRNVAAQIPNDTDSIFRIYSVTKAFTSTLVFKLIELKKLSLTDRLSKFYPNLPHANEITVEHLLTHTSGLYDYTHESRFPKNSEAALLALLSEKPLDFEVGKGWNYSNTNYCLLGHIVAKVSGTTYENAMRQHVFGPLGMTHSGFDFENLTSADKAVGYRIFSDHVKKPGDIKDSTGPFAAGAIYSTVGDLYRFHLGLQSGKILSKASLEKAWSASSQNSRYGYGWQLGSRFFRKKIVSHSGGAAGFRSNFSQIPQDGLCVILLNNHENANLEFLTDRIYDILYGYSVDLPAEIKLRASDLEKYVGTFLSVGDHPLTLLTSVVDGRLAIGTFGEPKCALLARGKVSFDQPEANAAIEFVMDGQGNYNDLVVHQNGPDLMASRLRATWGILGSATPQGWDGKQDVPLQETANQQGLWTAREVSLKDGEIKFRYNNDWNLNFGDNEQDGVLDAFGANLPVKSGVYSFTLDLREEGEPRYQIVEEK